MSRVPAGRSAAARPGDLRLLLARCACRGASARRGGGRRALARPAACGAPSSSPAGRRRVPRAGAGCRRRAPRGQPACSVPATARAGRAARGSRCGSTSPASATVDVRVAITEPRHAARRVLVVALGWVHTGRTLSVRWPRGARLVAGRLPRERHGPRPPRRARCCVAPTARASRRLTVTADPPAGAAAGAGPGRRQLRS